MRVVLSEAQRKALHLKHRTLGTGTGGRRRQGARDREPRADTAPVLLKQTTAVPVTVTAISGDRTVSLALDLGA